MRRLSNEHDEMYARGRRPGYFYVSKRFPEAGTGDNPATASMCRFAYEVFDSDGELQFQSDNGWELVLRTTPRRQQVKALFFEDTRHVRQLTIQRFNARGEPMGTEIANFSGPEVRDLAAFLALINSSVLDLAEQTSGLRLLPEGVESLLVNETSRQALFTRYAGVFAELFEADVDSPELIAFARRRRQVDVFERLLTDSDYFQERQRELERAGRLHGAEHVWQAFFEENKWIFGSALAVQYLHSWNPDKLEQTTLGASAFTHGKRPDALMRTAGALSALVFVEIKTHKTELLHREANPYRSGTWRASQDVVGGVAQCHTTVDETVAMIRDRQVDRLDDHGFSTGEIALMCRPRSILVVGALAQFVQGSDTSVPMFESFERFRRSLRDPEIVTFDEVYDRARLVLATSEARST